MVSILLQKPLIQSLKRLRRYSMATYMSNTHWFPETEEEYRHMSYDETCLVMFGMDSDELKEKRDGKNKG